MTNNRPKFSEISLEKRMLTEIPSLFLTEYLSYLIEYQFLDYTINADLNRDLKLEEIDLSDITVYFSDNFRAVIICINVRGMKRFFLALPANIIYYDLENLKLSFKKELEDYPPMVSSTQTALFCEYYDTYKVDGDTTPVVLKINFQYIQDDRINERNHTKIESIGRCGVTFKAMVDL